MLYTILPDLSFSIDYSKSQKSRKCENVQLNTTCIKMHKNKKNLKT